ncbi:MAG: hypothetical protein HY390_01630 [Deltaproteobacteria bacterium]|nr:hypothetical protein [Deltaproteobacteria bacterium]
MEDPESVNVYEILTSPQRSKKKDCLKLNLADEGLSLKHVVAPRRMNCKTISQAERAWLLPAGQKSKAES